MKNIKKIFTYMVVGALVAALSISCKSNEEPQAQETGSTTQSHPPAGNYISDLIGNQYASPSMINGKATVTNNLDGTCHITGTAYSDDTTYQNFDITITKWWYSYDDPNTYYADDGSGFEKSEGTINSPAADYFSVSYYKNSGGLRIDFRLSGSWYDTYTLVKK